MSDDAVIVCDNLVKIYKQADLEVIAPAGTSEVRRGQTQNRTRRTQRRPVPGHSSSLTAAKKSSIGSEVASDKESVVVTPLFTRAVYEPCR